MSRPAAAAWHKPEPTIRRARFAEEDLVSTFGEAMLAEARWLLRAGAVNLAAAGPAIEATIVAEGEHRRVALTPTQRGARVAFLGICEPTSLPQARRAQKPALSEATCVPAIREFRLQRRVRSRRPPPAASQVRTCLWREGHPKKPAKRATRFRQLAGRPLRGFNGRRARERAMRIPRHVFQQRNRLTEALTTCGGGKRRDTAPER
jgi:hypothetical protein